MIAIGSFEHASPLGQSSFGQTVRHVVRREKGQRAVRMLVVVPIDQVTRAVTRVLEAAEAPRELGTVIHGLELRLAERIVVRRVRPDVSLGHAEIIVIEGHSYRAIESKDGASKQAAARRNKRGRQAKGSRRKK